ncbi:putative peroxidase-related enzyme [Mumia flava]|uniref:Putative peroxidase-related enzyme n=1 Tax=Mumia flava TaxID=1348852 RepID=A0A0B2BD57_9ACTN|nr:hypothetical protein [Mumia flava]PJJ55895.1 putative peroxidase-related enzyme [Mumia flava]
MTSASFLPEPRESEALASAYEDDLRSDGYVNNLTRVWGWRPDVLADFTEVRATLLAGTTLDDREIAVVVVATASGLGDAYCSLAWGANLAALTDDETAAGVLADAPGIPTLSPRERALADWARQVARDPNSTTAEDVEALRAVGLTDREIFEATSLAAFRLAFSTVNDALGARPDAGLAARVPDAVRAAVTYGRPAADA